MTALAMTTDDVPTIMSSVTSATAYGYNDLMGNWPIGGNGGTPGGGGWVETTTTASTNPLLFKTASAAGVVNTINVNNLPKEITVSRRLVRVIVMDPNPNVALKDCVLYRGEEKLTDLTDQELFFELDVKTMLDKHNEDRVKIIDKSMKDRTEYLEPARVRDLKMVVVTAATF